MIATAHAIFFLIGKLLHRDNRPSMLWLATNTIQELGTYGRTLIGNENYHNTLWLASKTIRRSGLHKRVSKRVTDGLTYKDRNISGYGSSRQVATKMGEINPLSKFLSPLISFICGEDTVSVRGSFALQSWHHFWSWDHLRSNLGIICGTEIICRAVQMYRGKFCIWSVRRRRWLRSTKLNLVLSRRFCAKGRVWNFINNHIWLVTSPDSIIAQRFQSSLSRDLARGGGG